MADVRTRVLEDLAEEGRELERLVEDLDDERWHADTPAEGWTVAMQVAHLAWSDEQALLAATDRAAFEAAAGALVEGGAGAVDRAAAARAGESRELLLAGWRAGRTALRDALGALPDDAVLPWYGPPMSVTSMATGRLMETWAHGQDIVDALLLQRPATHRLRHVAHIAVAARDFAFRLHDLEPPTAPIHVALVNPVGGTWTWGPEDAAQRVTGDALAFCLLAVQRRHRGDVELDVVGEDADRWLDVVQAFAGPAGGGREPGHHGHHGQRTARPPDDA